LPEIAGDKISTKPIKRFPIGYFHIDIAEVRTGEGKLYLFVAIDRTSKFAFAQLHPTANVKTAVNFLAALIKSVLSSPITASSSATAFGTAQVRLPATGCTCSIVSAASTRSSIVSPSPTIHGPTAKSNG